MIKETSKIIVPVMVIGDGILGTLLARTLSKNKIDNILVGAGSQMAEKSAYLSNMSSFQSGLLQAYSYALKDLEDGKESIDFLFKVKSARRRLEKLSSKIAECIAKEDGILHIPLTNLEEYCAKVKILGYPKKYRKPLSNREAMRKLGNFYRKESQNYMLIPDRPFKLDKIVHLLKQHIINTLNVDNEEGNTFIFDIKPSTLNIQEKRNEEGEIRYDVTFEYVVYKAEKDHQGVMQYTISDRAIFNFETKWIVLCTGLNNLKILKSIDETYEEKDVKLRGFCLVKTENANPIGLKTPFFSRLEPSNYLNICKHTEASKTNPYQNVEALVSTTHKDILITEKEETHEALQAKNQKKIDNHRDYIVKTLNKNLNNTKEPLQEKKYSFCLHFHNAEKYAQVISLIKDTHIISAHPGLATNSIVIADEIFQNYLQEDTDLKKLNFTNAIRRRMDVRAIDMHNAIRYTKHPKSWIRA